MQKGLLKESLDLSTALEGLDYIYTDTWLDMEFFGRPEYVEVQKERTAKMLPYQVNSALLQNCTAKVLGTICPSI